MRGPRRARFTRRATRGSAARSWTCAPFTRTMPNPAAPRRWAPARVSSRLPKACSNRARSNQRTPAP